MRHYTCILTFDPCWSSKVGSCLFFSSSRLPLKIRQRRSGFRLLACGEMRVKFRRSTGAEAIRNVSDFSVLRTVTRPSRRTRVQKVLQNGAWRCGSFRGCSTLTAQQSEAALPRPLVLMDQPLRSVRLLRRASSSSPAERKKTAGVSVGAEAVLRADSLGVPLPGWGGGLTYVCAGTARER